MSTTLPLIQMQRLIFIQQDRFSCFVLHHHCLDLFNNTDQLSQLSALAILKMLKFPIFLEIFRLNPCK